MQKVHIHTRGFTLIETFVAVTILVTAVVGPLTLATRGVFSALAARDQFVAAYLAQDAMEAVRFIRDSNFLAGGGADWLAGLGPCTSGSCQIDTTENSISPPTTCSGTCDELLFDDSNGFYNYDTGEPSGFVRTIEITVPYSGAPFNGVYTDDERLVTVKIEWNTGPVERSYVIEGLIYDWLNVNVEAP